MFVVEATTDQMSHGNVNSVEPMSHGNVNSVNEEAYEEDLFMLTTDEAEDLIASPGLPVITHALLSITPL